MSQRDRTVVASVKNAMHSYIEHCRGQNRYRFCLHDSAQQTKQAEIEITCALQVMVTLYTTIEEQRMSDDDYEKRLEQSICRMIDMLPTASVYLVTSPDPTRTTLVEQVAGQLAQQTGKKITVVGPRRAA